MKTDLQKRLLLSATMLTGALGLVPTAHAQEHAQAQSDEVVVTARRVEERAQDVPISISVYNQQQLDNRNITTANDLAAITPGLSANARYGNDVANFQIRGAGQEARTTASVATYFADVVALRGGPGAAIQSGGDGAGPGSFFDLQNVQVLRGPQGTLFGRNTTGGAILLVPQLPREEFGGYAEASAGTFDLRRFQGVLNVPLTDTFRIRAGIDTMKRDGYTHNISGVGPDYFDDVNYTAGRLSAVWDITPTIQNYTIASFSSSDTNGTAQKLIDRYPGASPGNLSDELADVYTALAGTNVHTVYSLVPNPESKVRSWQVINRTTWQINDNVTFTNIASYGELQTTIFQDPYTASYLVGGGPQFAGFALAYAIPGGDIANQYTGTEEMRLSGTALNTHLDWQGGLYYEKSGPVGISGTASPSNGLFCSSVVDLECVNLAPAGATGSMQYQHADSLIENMAAYAQATYHLNDQWSATAGFRYTHDVTVTDANLGLLFFPTANNPQLFCLTQGPNLPGGAPLSTGQANTITTLQGNYCHTHVAQESEAPTWVLGLDYKPTDNILLFAKYSRGYRQGSTNPYGAFGFQTYDPEHLDTYEAGLKTDWRGPVPGHFNFTAFKNDLADAQVVAAALDLSFIISPNTFISNGASEASGFELDTGVTLFHRLHLGATAGYIDSNLKSLSTPAIPAGSPFDILLPVSVKGEPTIFTPQKQYTITASFDVPIEESAGTLTLNADYDFVDDQYATFANLGVHSVATGGAPGLVPAHALVNFSVNWNGVFGTPVDAALFGTNVFDKDYILNPNERVSTGINTYSYGAPAMYGVRVRYNFGG